MSEKATKREKLSLRRDVAEASSYSTEPKASTGQGRIAPIRNQGESELRIRAGNADFDGNWLNLAEMFDGPSGYMSRINTGEGGVFLDLQGNPVVEGVGEGTLKEEQIEQVLRPRGYVSDMDAEIFSDFDGSSEKSRLYYQSRLDNIEYFNRKAQGMDRPALIQALVDHYGMPISDEVQEAVDLLSSISETDASDPLKRKAISELLHGPLFAFMFDPKHDPQAVMEAKLQAEQLKIRQNYLEKISGQRLPRFVVPDTAEFPYDPEAMYIGLMLPYRKCLFILNPGVNARLVYCEQLDDDKIKLTVKISTHGEDNADTIGEFQFEWKEGELIEEGWFSDEFTKVTAQELRCILAILDGMSKNYVVAEGDPPPKDRVIPEARKGCTVRVVKLHPQSETIRKAWQGGTHASPREHTRIAHWRRNCHGVRVRILEKIVNKGKTDGVVDKEYYIRKRDAIARRVGIKTKRKK